MPKICWVGCDGGTDGVGGTTTLSVSGVQMYVGGNTPNGIMVIQTEGPSGDMQGIAATMRPPKEPEITALAAATGAATPRLAKTPAPKIAARPIPTPKATFDELPPELEEEAGVVVAEVVAV